MEAMTIQKYIHTSPRKLRLVMDMIRKMKPVDALDVLAITPKAAVKDLSAAVKTALANAKVQGLDADKISFKKLEVWESIKMRRMRAGTRGRTKPYKRRMSHIKVVLSDNLSAKGKGKREKLEKIEKKEEK